MDRNGCPILAKQGWGTNSEAFRSVRAPESVNLNGEYPPGACEYNDGLPLSSMAGFEEDVGRPVPETRRNAMDNYAPILASGIDWDRFMNGDVFPVRVVWTVIAIMIVIWVVAVQWRRVRIAEADVGLKLKMLERGYSADEIARVLEAGIPAKEQKRRRSSMDKGCCTSDFIRGGAST